MGKQCDTYIRKQDVKDLIDSKYNNDDSYKFDDYEFGYNGALDMMDGEIDDMHECYIIHCRDCLYSCTDKNNIRFCINWSDLRGAMPVVYDYEFCSRGVKRE